MVGGGWLVEDGWLSIVWLWMTRLLVRRKA